METTTCLPHYILFGTAGCHLCEVAQQMLEALWQGAPAIAVETVDISSSDALMECYGVRIPVLRDPEGRELGWPFTPAQLRAFVG
jgi:hypothetical protein